MPDNLRTRAIWGTCQGFQGALAQLPATVAGLPRAEVRETRCLLRGDPYCEWEFTWQEAGRRGLYRLWPWATQDKRVREDLQSQGLPRPALSVPFRRPKESRPPCRPARASLRIQAPRWTGTTRPWPAPRLPVRPLRPSPRTPARSFPPLPEFMQVRPYGADERGKPIRQANGSSIVGVIAQMQDYAAEQAVRSLPTHASEAERQAAAARARREALDLWWPD